jgi:hypothetical protein
MTVGASPRPIGWKMTMTLATRAAIAAPSSEPATRIGLITATVGRLDRWSSIYVDGDRSWFETFDPVNRSVFRER